MRRAPTETFLGQLAGCGHIDTGEHAEPAEVVHRVFGAEAGHRQPKSLADGSGDLVRRNAFVADSVVGGAGLTFLQRETVEVRRVEPVSGGPPVGAVADVGGDAL